MVRPTLFLLALLAITSVPVLAGQGGDRKLDPVLRERARAARGTSRVIIRTVDGSGSNNLILALHGTPAQLLPSMRGQVADVPDSALGALAADASVLAVSLDRPVQGATDRTAVTVGATWVRENLGVDGSGVGVAIVDSGVTSWHDDLGSDRVVHFVDFVGSQPLPYDDYGHGTHVAGVIAGNGYDSDGARRGIAPGASLVVLKVLDGEGNGYISTVIAALDYAIAHRAQFNIRVLNLSVASGVYESYNTDPLTLAAKRAVEAGIVIVTAAGNFGRDAKGHTQYGAVTSPGNAPWVLTVGASSHNGTANRADDSIAAFSSRGPSYIDYAAKPDLVAPGVGIESLADSSSQLFSSHPGARLWGTIDTATPPYLSLSGTSMAAPVVAGTVALMLQANPKLTPNLVKAILQYTAEHRVKYDDLTQGAGFLNARGAVQLARSFGRDRPPATIAKDPTPWNAHINWGNRRIGGGLLKQDANAWRTDVTWGASSTGEGAQIVWGTACDATGCDNSVWGIGSGADKIASGTFNAADDVNIVRSAACQGADCEDIVWGTGCDTRDPSCTDIWRQAPAAMATIPRRGAR
jgi:serine protease AprX